MYRKDQKLSRYVLQNICKIVSLLQDKMSQMHELCLRDYQLAILDTAFLVHKPGIKRKDAKTPQSKSEGWRKPFLKANAKAYKEIMTEFRKK